MSTVLESKRPLSAAEPAGSGLSSDDADLANLGYEQKMHRTMSAFTSFALAFSMVPCSLSLMLIVMIL